jgi:DNA polymerase elongation subunit (family B)
MEQIPFSSITEYNTYKKNYKDSIELFGSIDPQYQFISEQYTGKVDFNPKDIRVFLYDIEVINLEDDPNMDGFPKPEDAAVPVVSFSLKDLKSNIMYCYALVDYDPSKTILDLGTTEIIFEKFETERELLLKFIELFETLHPDVLIGYYSKSFDDPYILHRILKVLGERYLKKLSPCNSVTVEFKENKFGKIEPRVLIKGLQVLDYLELYKKFIPAGRESYSLDFIAKYELGDNKIEYADFENLKEFYQKDPQLATDYNIYDSELIHLLDKKLGLISLVFTIAYMAKVNFEDVISPIRTWDSLIYNNLKEKGIVIPPQKHNMKEQYPGAYVRDPECGIYDWIMTYDLASLYPHIIMQYGISPETIVTKELIGMDINKIDDEIKSLENMLT